MSKPLTHATQKTFLAFILLLTFSYVPSRSEALLGPCPGIMASLGGGSDWFIREQILGSHIAALDILDRKNPEIIPDGPTKAAADQLDEAFGRDFRVLALHPGILRHLKQFIEFMKSQSPRPSPSTAYSVFREKLGYVTLIRALKLTPEEALAVKKNGLRSNAERSGESHEQILKQIATLGVSKLINTHMNYAGAKTSLFSSFSQVEAIAAWVTNVSDGNVTNRYIYQIHVPVLDIVYLHINKDRNKIEEALVFGNFGPSQILNLESIQPENFSVSTADILEELRDSWGISRPLIPEYNWPAPLTGEQR